MAHLVPHILISHDQNLRDPCVANVQESVVMVFEKDLYVVFNKSLQFPESGLPKTCDQWCS